MIYYFLGCNNSEWDLFLFIGQWHIDHTHESFLRNLSLLVLIKLNEVLCPTTRTNGTNQSSSVCQLLDQLKDSLKS